MKFRLKNVAAATGLMLSLVGAISPAFATIILDQGNAALSPQSFGLSSELTWQQGVTAGQTGKLSNVDVFFLEAGSVEFSIYGSAPWNTSTAAFRSVVNVTSGWNSINVDSANFYVDIGKQFSIGLHGVGPPDTVGPSFGGSGVFGGNNNGAYAGGELWWQFQDQFGRGTNPQPLGAPIDPPIYDMGFRTYVETNVYPPTDVELAKLSEAVYTNGAQDLSGFAYIQSDLGLGFGAAAFKRGNEIVVAFRGTDFPSASADVLKDVAADVSYITGSTPTPAMKSYATQAAAFLAQIQANNPGLNITVTGHSLGGALAQLVGKVSGFKTVAFDAPGPANLLGSLANELSSANNLSGGQSGSISTYRLWGDQVSAVGTQLGSLTTLGPVSGQNQLVLTFTEAIANHRMLKMISALGDNNTLRAGGLQGPTLNWINAILPTSVKVINGLDVYSLSFSALSLVDVGIDPVGAGGYTFVLANGSPALHSLMLPNFDGISRYLVSTDAGGVLTENYLDPLTWFTFSDNTNKFSFFGLDAFGQKQDFRGSILFDLRFRDDGYVNAELIAQPTNNSVPEPSTWIMLIFGFGFVGISFRRKSRFSYNPVPYSISATTI